MMLRDYAIYVDKLRTYAGRMPLKVAVDKTIKECIKLGVLKDILTKFRLEVTQMSIFEYDYNGHMELIREEGKEDGYAVGREVGRTEQLRSQISIKLKKGKSLEQIADEVEETIETIKPIYDELLAADK